MISLFTLIRILELIKIYKLSIFWVMGIFHHLSLSSSCDWLFTNGLTLDLRDALFPSKNALQK